MCVYVWMYKCIKGIVIRSLNRAKVLLLNKSGQEEEEEVSMEITKKQKCKFEEWERGTVSAVGTRVTEARCSLYVAGAEGIPLLSCMVHGVTECES